MIVQTAPEGQAHFIITQVDHARASGQLAAAFGNAAFAPLDPHDPMLYIVAHHDEGWAAVDAAVGLDPLTRLPYHLTRTPILSLIATGGASPDHNEAYHPYSGIISSMHTYGLYHGRYGLSDKVFINTFPDEHRSAVDAMLYAERARQARLTAQLDTDQAHLFHNYKLLQFFDTLALYFHTTHAAARQPSTFKNVPRAIGDDVMVTITPLADSTYRVSPYPFTGEALTLTTRGRWLRPLEEGESLADALAAAPFTEQMETIVA